MGDLYSEICKVENLLSAWEKVKAKGSTGGIDNVSIDIFEKNLDANLKQLSGALASLRYIPEPYKELKIPKDENEFRSLSLPTIRDKIVQQSTKEVIEPILGEEFLDVSYAYRTGKGALKAINRVRHLITNEKRGWVTLCDIDSYFNNIDHELLFSALSQKIQDEELLMLIRLWVKMGKVDKRMRWKDTTKGIPQGSVVSPLISNFYLQPFDELMVKKQYGYVRYADDFVIISYSESEAYRTLETTKRFLRNHLKLHLNPTVEVKRVETGFEFLGILFKGSELTITDDKVRELKERISLPLTINNASQDVIRELTETVTGIGRYYRNIISEEILEELDVWLVDCL